MSKTKFCTLASLGLLAGCTADDTGYEGVVPTRPIAVTIANTAPVYPLVHTGRFEAGIGPGGAAAFTFTAGRGHRVSFATMFSESNDYFYAPDGVGIALYDAAGAPRSGDVTSEVKLWDAGTEIDQEPGLGPDQAPRQQTAGAGARDPQNMVRPAMNLFGNLPAVEDVVRVTLTAHEKQQFTLTIENVSTQTTLTTSDGVTRAVPLSPGVWVINEGRDPLFSSGFADRNLGLEQIAEDGDHLALDAALARRAGVTATLSPGVWIVHASPGALFDADAVDRGWGLERIAEEGDPAELAEALADAPELGESGTFEMGETAVAPGPIGPGGAFSFVIRARPGDHLSFATMFGDSDDAFFAPLPEGIPLFDSDGDPWFGAVGGVRLWDAGTEVNQEPGVGNDQAPRQLAPGAGSQEAEPIVLISERDDGFVYPDPGATIRVTVEAVTH